MAIKLYMGYLGSGKTLSTVREIAFSPMPTFTNIKTKNGLKTYLLNKDAIIHNKKVGEKKKRDGTTEDIVEMDVNFDFWEKAKKKHVDGFNIVIDEAHSIIDARASMSKQNRIAKRWASSLRKIISCKNGSGDVILISQLPRGIDVWAKELCNQYRWHEYVSHRECNNCKERYVFNSSSEEPQERCPSCDYGNNTELASKLISYRFKTIEDVEAFIYYNQRSYYFAEVINNPNYFYRFYDTFQIENLFE